MSEEQPKPKPKKRRYLNSSRHGYIGMPKELMSRTDIGSLDKLCLISLIDECRTRNSHAQVGYGQMRVRTGCSKNAALRAINRLLDAGYIQKVDVAERQRDGKRCEYSISWQKIDVILGKEDEAVLPLAPKPPTLLALLKANTGAMQRTVARMTGALTDNNSQVTEPLSNENIIRTYIQMFGLAEARRIGIEELKNGK